MRRRARRMRAPWLRGVSARRRRELAVVFALIFGSAAGVSRLAAGPVPFVAQPAISNGADEVWSTYAADIDGDGDLDALSASRSDDAIAWYENEAGDGTSWTARTISSDADNARSIFAADVDGDGDLDVLSASFSDDAIAWYENDAGDGTNWTARTISNVADGASSVHAADLDGDGDLDVLSASRLDHSIAWYENETGDGTNWTARTVSSVASGAYSVFAADVDGDGDVDALSASNSSDTIAWYENETGGGTSWTARTIATVAFYASAVHAADVDGDGDIDALSTASLNGLIAWHENVGGDGMSWATRTISSVADGASSVFAADVDGDGDLDAVSAGIYGSVVAWHENVEGDGTSWTRYTIASGATGGTHSAIAADVDSDGDLDALSGRFYNDQVAWYENRTIHRSALFVGRAVIGSPADGPFSVYAADMDGDGDLDALSTSLYDDEIAWYENDGGDGTSWASHTISSAADGASSVFAADVDGDGDIDALSASYYDDAIRWYENEVGNGTSWTARAISSTADGASSVFAADMDDDGDLDALSGSFYDDAIAWYENEGGDGTSWEARTISSSANGALSVFAADVDGDGDLDALSASREDHEIVWYENEGGDETSWEARTISSSANGARSVFAADVDGDGDLDTLSASFYDNKIAWYENEGGDGTSWTARTISNIANGAFSVFAADVDGDGDLDALSASSFDDTVAWYPNRGGQFALPTTAVAQGVLADSQEDVALQIDLEHRGRAGDSDVALDSVELRLEDGAGSTLNDSQANALIEKLELFLDDGNGTFGPGDPLVEVVDPLTLDVDGQLSIPLVAGDPDVEVAFGESKRYYVVVTMTANASEQTPASFELFHLTESSSSAHDASTPAAPFTPQVPLRLEFLPDTTTGPVDTVLSTASCKAPFELDLEGFLVDTPVVCEAGTTLTVGEGVKVSPTGDLTLRAGQRVRFVTDFSVEPGGELAAEIDPELEP